MTGQGRMRSRDGYRGKRVALFLTSLVGGGAERMMIRLAELLHLHGLSVDLVVVRNEGEYAASVPPEINLVDLKKAKPSKAIFALARYLERRKTDVLLSTMASANYTAILAARLWGGRSAV